jgi:hypothetical protein
MRGKKNNDVKDAAASKKMLKITTDTFSKQKLIQHSHLARSHIS